MVSIFFALVVISCCWTLSVSENLVPLPSIVSPINYRLTLLPILEKNQRLCGHVWIDVTARMETTMIILHAAQDLTVMKVIAMPITTATDGLKLEFQDSQLVEDLCFNGVVFQDSVANFHNIATGVYQDGQKELITVTLAENMKRGAMYRIGLLYTAAVNDMGSKGFFRVQYEAGNSADCCKRIIGATQLEAIHARKMFPCLDEPAHKATFQVMVGRATTLTAISNMPLASSTPMTSVDDWMWDTFETSPVMSTYLVACIITEFDHVDATYRSVSGRNVTLRLWTQSHKLTSLDFALDLIPKVMPKLEEYLGMPYVLPKLDFIAVPGYDDGKAMENWGLVVHSEESLLLDETSDYVDKALVAVTVVHEAAHQWFGNLVTSTWWDDIWLNEGLTTLFESLILAEVAPDVDYKTVLLVFLHEVMRNDLLVGSHPLNAPVTDFPTIDDKFDYVAYAKGAAIFRMVKSFVGEEAFQSAARRYINKYQYGVANSTDFFNLINQEGRRTHTISGRMNVARIMKTWTHQPGYPLVHVHRGKNGIIHISQRPFKGGDMPSIDNATMAITASWWVPISLTDSETRSFSADDTLPIVWLSPRKPSVELNGPKGANNWILVNFELSSYYRVNYDRTNWDLISEQLLRDHTVIPYLTRAQLVDDAFTLGHAKVITYDVALSLTRYLSKTSDDTLIRKMVKNHMEFIETTGENSIQTVDKQKMLRSMASYINPERKSRMANDLVISGGDCDTGDRQCVNGAIRLFRSFINGSVTPEQDKSANSESMWCAAIRHGSQLEWSFAWNVSRRADGQTSQRRRMLKAMCCTTDPVRIKQLLTRVLHPNIKQEPKETSIIINRLITNNPSARSASLTFLLSNWAFFDKHFLNPSAPLELLATSAKHSLSTEELEKIKAFVTDSSAKLDSGGVGRVLTAVSNNLHWLSESRQQAPFIDNEFGGSSNDINKKPNQLSNNDNGHLFANVTLSV